MTLIHVNICVICTWSLSSSRGFKADTFICTLADTQLDSRTTVCAQCTALEETLPSFRDVSCNAFTIPERQKGVDSFTPWRCLGAGIDLFMIYHCCMRERCTKCCTVCKDNKLIGPFLHSCSWSQGCRCHLSVYDSNVVCKSFFVYVFHERPNIFVATKCIWQENAQR